MTDQPRRFGRALASSFIGQGVAGVMKVATAIVAARLVGPTSFGEYSLATVVVLLAFSLGNLGVASGTTFRVRQGADGPDAAYTSMVLALGLGVLAGLIAAGVVSATPSVVDGLSQQVLVVAVVSIPAYFVVNAAVGLLLGREDYRSYNALTITVFAVLLLSTAATGAAFGTAFAVTAAWTGTYSAAALVLWVLLGFSWRSRRPRIDRAHAARTLSFGTSMHASSVVTFLSLRIDIVFVAALLGATDAGLYAAAVAVGEGVWFFSQVASTVLFARVSGERDSAARRELADVVTRLVMVGSVGAAIVIAALATPIVTLLYSSEFAPSVDALRVLLLGIVAVSLSRMLANYIAAIGRPNAVIPGSVIALLVNIVLNLVLIPRWGIVGAAAASTVSYGVAMMHRVHLYATADGRRHPIGFLRPRRSDLALLRAAVTRG